MASLNRVMLIGNLGADPEIRHSTNGDAVTNIRIAITESWRDKTSGEKKEETEWVRIVFFGKLADTAGKYLTKGSPVYVEGRIKTRKWQDKDGQDRYSTEIVADRMQMLGSKPPVADDAGERPRQPTPSPTQKKRDDAFDDLESDVPF